MTVRGFALGVVWMLSLRWYTWKKIIWRENMEKIARRNIMSIYEDWSIFRRILKHDLALDRMSSRWRMALSGRREDRCLQSGRWICPLRHPDGWWPYPLEFPYWLPIDWNRKMVDAEPEWSEPIPWGRGSRWASSRPNRSMRSDHHC